MKELNDIIEELEKELKYIPTVPASEMSMRQQQVELSTSCQHIIQITEELLENQRYLLERLTHSEFERFKTK